MTEMTSWLACLLLLSPVVSADSANEETAEPAEVDAWVKPVPAEEAFADLLPKQWTLVVERQGEATGPDERTVRKITGELGSKARLDLDSGTWWGLLKTPGAWAEPFEMVWPPPAEDVGQELLLHPAGRIRGTVKNSEVTRGFYVRFERVQQGKDKGREGWSPCFFDPVAENEPRAFHCEVPLLGPIDLRFWARGYAEKYVWGADTSKSGGVDVGELSLAPGASIVGWVEAEGGGHLLQKAKLELRPSAGGESRSPEAQRRASVRARKAQPDARGFFQWPGLEPGIYVVSATLEGYAPAQVSVRVWPGKTTRLDDPPLTLRPPSELELLLHPPMPPGAGESWHVVLERVDRAGRPLEEIGRLNGGLGGHVVFDRVPYGGTRLSVMGPDETVWYVKRLDIEQPYEQIFVDMKLTEVRGSVKIGEEPVSGSLAVGRGFSGAPVLPIDEKGSFQGYFPGDGPWQLVVRSADKSLRKTFVGVDSEPVPGKSWRRVDLQIQKTAIRGRVVDPDLEPIAHAQVTAIAMAEHLRGREAITVQKSDDLGNFEILGPPGGGTALSAVAVFGGNRLASRRPLQIEVEGFDSDPVELVLYPTKKFRARVSHGGLAISGAVVSAIDVDNLSTSRTPRMVTDEEGGLSLDLPDSARQVILAVAAPGFAYTITKVPVGDYRAEIQIGRESGTLALELPPELLGYGREIAGLFYNGAFMPMLTLQSWALLQGGRPWEAPRIEIPEMAPGAYRVCRISRSGLDVAARNAPLDPGRCSGGFLASGGRLELTINSP